MAEGDTILRTARRLDAVLSGRRISARAPSPRGQLAGIERLDGRRVESVESIGKHLLVHFEGEVVLHSHLGMNGSWQVYERGTSWRKPAAGAWVALSSDAYDAVQFGGPTLRVLEARRLASDPTLSRLGPDILGAGFRIDEGVESLRSAGPTVSLGEALLDQRLLAGVGNIYKCESCFAAGISPWHWLGELEDDELAYTVRRARELMRDAAGGGRQPRHVYGRSGKPCPRCGARIRARGQGDENRATYWCPGCQF